MVRKPKQNVDKDLLQDANEPENRSGGPKTGKAESKTGRKTEKVSREVIERIVADLFRYMARLSVLNDMIIKHLLGEPGKSEERLRSFINAIRKQANQSLIQEVVIAGCENYPDSINDKTTFLDIKARDDEGSWYNVEIQLANHPSFTSRLLYYWAKLHASQLKKGAEYREICPTISITLTAFDLFPGLPDAFHSFHLVNDRYPEMRFSEDIQFYVIQLTPNMPPKRLANLCQDLVNWICLFNCPHTKEENMVNVLLKNPDFVETTRDLTDYVSNNRRRARMEAREKNRRDLVDIEYGGYLRGIELGEKRGIELGEKRGIELGEKRGEKRGIELGEKRGIELGEKRGKVKMIIQALRFKTNGDVPESLQKTLGKIEDLEYLDTLFTQSMSVSSLSEFEKSLDGTR